MINTIFWSKAEDLLYNRMYEAKTCRINPEQYIEFLRLDIKELTDLLQNQKRNKHIEVFK